MRCLPFLSLFGMANKEKPKGQRHSRCPLGCAARACSVCGACAHQAGRGGAGRALLPAQKKGGVQL